MSGFDNSSSERLLSALAEQIKAPLVEIARLAELAQQTDIEDSLKTIEYTADMALRLVDSYLLSTQLQSEALLNLEPVSVSAVLQETAEKLQALAKQSDCDLEISIQGRYGPVMAHRPSLEAAYISLGYAFIQSLPEQNKRHHIVLGAHGSKAGLVAGVFGENIDITADMFKRAKALYGTAHIALPSLSFQSGAAVFIADSLLKSMASPLRVAKHHALSGLAATLIPSQQLRLV